MWFLIQGFVPMLRYALVTTEAENAFEIVVVTCVVTMLYPLLGPIYRPVKTKAEFDSYLAWKENPMQ